MKKYLLLTTALIVMSGNAWTEESANTTSGDCSKTENDSCVWSYDEASKTLTISGTGNMKNFNGKCDSNGSHCGSLAPWYDLDVVDVKVEAGIKSIGKYAFYGDNIQSVSLPEGLETIEIGSFRIMGNLLQEINFPSTLKNIRTGAFNETYLTGVDIILPEGMESIETEAFALTNIGTLVLPSSIRSENLSETFLTDTTQERYAQISTLYCTEAQMAKCEAALIANKSDFKPTRYEKSGNDYLVYDEKGNVVGKYASAMNLNKGVATETYKYDSAGHLVGIFDGNGQRTWGKKIYTVEEAMESTAKGDKFHVSLTYK